MVYSIGNQKRRGAGPSIGVLRNAFSRIVFELITTETERARPVEIKLSLFSTVCGRASNVFMVAIAMFVCGFAAFMRDGDWLAPTVAAVGFLLFMERCGTITKVRDLQKNLLPVDPDLWLARFGLSAIGSSVCWGLLTLSVLTRSHDPVLISITVIANVGSCGALAARNAGASKLAKSMLLLCVAPMVPGVFFADDKGYVILAFLVPALIAGLCIVIDEHNQQLVDFFESQQTLLRLSNMDFLTKISNRRHFNELLAATVSRSLQAWRPFSLLMLDVDYFKAFNDRYGHLDGDRCLQRIAAMLSQITNDRDVVSRFGGEEFALLLEDTDQSAALIIAGKIRDAVEVMGQPHENRPDEMAVVTISIGVSSMRRGENNSDALIKAADDALYEAKRRGRNQVVGV